MPLPEPVLRAADVERRFGPLQVLRGVSLAVAPGELVLVGGANGAGKTTFLRILAGLTRPTKGNVQLLGTPVRGVGSQRSAIGLLSHQSFLYDDLTPRENLRFTAQLYSLSSPEALVAEWLDRVGIGGRSDVPVANLSRGTVQRVAIARALLHNPRVLLLDEPFTGLDGSAADRVRAVLADRLSLGLALVLVTHSLAEAWNLATRVVVLGQGRWVIDEPRPEALDDFLPRYRAALDG